MCDDVLALRTAVVATWCSENDGERLWAWPRRWSSRPASASERRLPPRVSDTAAIATAEVKVKVGLRPEYVAGQ